MDTIIDDPGLPADFDSQPLVQAAAALYPTLRALREQTEREQRLPPALVEQLHDAGFYRMVIPRSLGGLQVDPITYTRVVEHLAEGCGSVGWNLANNSIGQLVTLGLPDEGVHEIHGQGEPSRIAGTAVQGGGQATPVDGGYRVTGHWTFGTGCQEAAWMLGSFQILDKDGEPRRRPDGGSLYWRGVFRKSDVEIDRDSWDVAGLRGTGSFDWRVKDVFLPEHRTCPHVGVPLDNQWSRWPGITYALPSPCWVGPHHSSVITGIALGGVNALIELACEKTPRGRDFRLRDNPQVQDAVGRADAILNAGRCYRSAMIAEIWQTIASGRETTLEQRARCRLASTNAADAARESMRMMYELGGSTSFKRASRLAECWRDLHVVGQTVTIGAEWYPIAGRALLGMETGPRLR
jgi:indole-3-acetate monooxygenase